MEFLGKAVEEFNFPKLLVEKTEKFLVALLGPSVNEMSAHIADNFRYRRLKNQVKIFSKAQDLLKEKGCEPRSLNLKTLVPLLEATSLEEDESLQEKWAILISSISSNNVLDFESKLVKTLAELSVNEALVLDTCYKSFKDAFVNHERPIDQSQLRKEMQFHCNTVLVDSGLDVDNSYVIFDNLKTLGLIKSQANMIYQAPDPRDTDKLRGVFSEAKTFFLSEFGLVFIEKCTHRA